MPPRPELRGVWGATSPRCGGLVCKGAPGSDAYGQRGFANQALRPQTVATGTEGPVESTDRPIPFLFREPDTSFLWILETLMKQLP